MIGWKKIKKTRMIFDAFILRRGMKQYSVD